MSLKDKFKAKVQIKPVEQKETPKPVEKKPIDSCDVRTQCKTKQELCEKCKDKDQFQSGQVTKYECEFCGKSYADLTTHQKKCKENPANIQKIEPKIDIDDTARRITEKISFTSLNVSALTDTIEKRFKILDDNIVHTMGAFKQELDKVRDIAEKSYNAQPNNLDKQLSDLSNAVVAQSIGKRELEQLEKKFTDLALKLSTDKSAIDVVFDKEMSMQFLVVYNSIKNLRNSGKIKEALEILKKYFKI